MGLSTANLFVITALCILSLGCRSDDDDGDSGGPDGVSMDATVDGAFLSNDHFRLDGKPEVRRADKVESKIRHQGLFRNRRYGDAKDAKAPEETCSIVEDKVTVEPGSVTVHYRADSSQCPAEDAGQTNKSVIKIKVYAKVTCTETNLEDYAGLSAAALVNQDLWHFCQDDSVSTTIVNVAMTVDSAEEGSAEKGAAVVGGLMDRNFGPCVQRIENDRRSADGCTMRAFARIGGEINAHEVYELIGAAGDAFSSGFDAGGGAITINDWQGSITFAPGEAASYSMTNGVETVEGKAGYVANLLPDDDVGGVVSLVKDASGR